MALFTGYSGTIWQSLYAALAFYNNQLVAVATAASGAPSLETFTTETEVMYASLRNGAEAVDAYALQQAWALEGSLLQQIAALPITINPSDEILFNNRMLAYENAAQALSGIVPQPPYGQTTMLTNQGASIVPYTGLLEFFEDFNFETAPISTSPITITGEAQAVANAFLNIANAISVFQGNNLTQLYDVAYREYLCAQSVANMLNAFTSGPLSQNSAFLNTYSGNFASGSYLINGVNVPQNQAVVNTRTSTAWYFNASGVLQSSPPNAIRIGYNPIGLGFLGAIVEPQAINVIPNSTMVGATSGGVFPTGWVVSGSAGVSITCVNTGTEFGMPFIDIKVSGTAGSGNFQDIVCTSYFVGTQIISTFLGQSVAVSFYTRFVSGSFNNFENARLTLQANNSAGAGIAFVGDSQIFSYAASGLQYITYPGTNISTNWAYWQPFVGLSAPNGAVVNITVRLYQPQLEMGLVPTSPIQTSGTSVTRTPDALTFNSTVDANWLFGIANASGVPSTQTFSNISDNLVVTASNLNQPYVQTYAGSGFGLNQQQWNQMATLPAMLLCSDTLNGAGYTFQLQQQAVLRYLMLTTADQLSVLSLSLRSPTTDQINITTLNVNETLIDVAARTLGNYELWPQIAELNNLSPPYVGATSIAISGIAGWGSQILLPTPGTSLSAIGTVPSYTVNFLGNDLYIGGINQPMPAWTGDFQVIGGYSNLAISLGRRLQTTLGSMIYHSDFGCRIPPEVGAIQDNTTAGHINAFGISAILSDPRVSQVTQATTQLMSNGLVQFQASCQPGGFDTPGLTVNQVIGPVL